MTLPDFIARAEKHSPGLPRSRGWETLHQDYYQQRARWQDRLWDSPDGMLLESDIRQCLREQGPLQAHGAIFGTPRTVALYWDLLNECESNPDNILLLGERGSGKEVITQVLARELKRELVPVNCSMLVESVAEAQLFGVAGGAGIADVNRKGSQGFVQQAEGGVLFLDELFDAPPSIFPKLLRLLQQRTYFRVGDPKEQKLEDTVIVGASNAYPTRRQLEAAMVSGKPRPDMVDRFSVFFEIPPLRERREEIPFIANTLLNSLFQRTGNTEDGRPRFPFLELARESGELLVEPRWQWTGNVRTLHTLLRSQGKLQRHVRQDHYALWIPREALERLEPVLPPTEVEAPSEEDALSAWDTDGLRKLREEQLLAFLRAELAREHLLPAQVDADWVSERCRRTLKVRNVSQKLRDSIRRTCAEIAQALKETT